MKIFVLQNYDGVDEDAGAFLTKESAQKYADDNNPSTGFMGNNVGVVELEVRENA